MNDSDKLLRQLYRAAARSPGRPPAPANSALEAAVLAQWRAARKEDDPAPVLLLFRRAALLALLLTALSGAWTCLQSHDTVETTAMASYAMMQLPP